jgi:hypothetical protein
MLPSPSHCCQALYWTSIAAASYAQQQQQQTQDSPLSRFLTTLRLINFLAIGHNASLLSHRCSLLRRVVYLSLGFIHCRLVLLPLSLSQSCWEIRQTQTKWGKQKEGQHATEFITFIFCIDVGKTNRAFSNY